MPGSTDQPQLHRQPGLFLERSEYMAIPPTETADAVVGDQRHIWYGPRCLSIAQDDQCGFPQCLATEDLQLCPQCRAIQFCPRHIKSRWIVHDEACSLIYLLDGNRLQAVAFDRLPTARAKRMALRRIFQNAFLDYRNPLWSMVAFLLLSLGRDLEALLIIRSRCLVLRHLQSRNPLASVGIGVWRRVMEDDERGLAECCAMLLLKFRCLLDLKLMTHAMGTRDEEAEVQRQASGQTSGQGTGMFCFLVSPYIRERQFLYNDDIVDEVHRDCRAIITAVSERRPSFWMDLINHDETSISVRLAWPAWSTTPSALRALYEEITWGGVSPPRIYPFAHAMAPGPPNVPPAGSPVRAAWSDNEFWEDSSADSDDDDDDDDDEEVSGGGAPVGTALHGVTIDGVGPGRVALSGVTFNGVTIEEDIADRLPRLYADGWGDTDSEMEQWFEPRG